MNRLLETLDPAMLTFNGSHPPSAAVQTVPEHSPTDYLNQLLIRALLLGASDLHFEASRSQRRICFRVDGVMQELESLPAGFGHQLCTRLKVLAGMDISEPRQAQNGRFRLDLDADQGVDFRCSSVPTLHGETLVLRRQQTVADILPLTGLGLLDEQLVLLQHALSQPQGLILITGPTGSGKTITLYSLLCYLRRQARSIYSVEDPVEIDLPGINQLLLSERLGFLEAIRAVLRQDPDVLVIGEIRSGNALQAALEAAHTGHLVLATLHAGDAPQALARLRHLGGSAPDLANTLSLVIAQRLLRQLDSAHKEPYTPGQAELQHAGVPAPAPGRPIWRPRRGAQHEAYRSRRGIFELLGINPERAGQLLQADGPDVVRQQLADQGHIDLRRAAWHQVQNGQTSLNELVRVLGALPPRHNDGQRP